MNFDRICSSHFDSKMPLSEFYGSVNGKNESPQPKATDISYIPNDEFVELVWEKGQIMMQGQSSKARKTPVSSNFQFHTSKAHEKEQDLLDVAMPSFTSVEMGLNQDDDMVRWLDYPLDDYCSDLLPEISGVTVNEPSMYNGVNEIDKRGNCNQINKDSHLHTHNFSLHDGVSLDQSNASKISSSRTSHLFSWSLDQMQNLNPPVRSGVSAIGSSNARSKPHNVTHKDSIESQSSSGRLEKLVQKQGSLLPYSSSGLLNFSHFSRAAAMARVNLQNNGSLADSGSCGLDIMKNNDHAGLNVVNHGPQKELGFLSQQGLRSGNVASNPLASKPLEELHCVEKSSTDCREDATDSDKSPNVVLDANAPKGGPDTENSIEPIGASSSVCSGNSADRASNDLTKSLKRKSRDTEDFECQSEDIEEESLGTKTAGTSRGGTGSKRSRAAEVHNLSERRRRDRINEKMRALQELIPNCNKVDKASMLDEAIEYLKTLQLQVQIMSMGTGLCMPPMMFPNGMQRMHPTHVPHFSPMGIGMGMGYGMGMGMGMGEMNGGSQGHPHMFPFPPTTQGSRYPVPSPPISGLGSCQGIPRSTFQVYGHPMLFPQSPMPRFPMGPAVQQMGTHVEVQDLAPSSKDPMQNKNPHVMMTQTSTQCQVAKESLNQSTSVDQKDQVLEPRCNTAGVD